MKAMRCSTLKGRSSWAVRMFFGGWFEHVIAARTKPTRPKPTRPTPTRAKPIRTIWLLAAAPGALAQNEKAPPLAPSRKGGWGAGPRYLRAVRRDQKS